MNDVILQEVPLEKIVAVSKGQPVEKIRWAYQHGLRIFAENYLQEALPKIEELDLTDIRWHYIGRLQRKKVRQVVGRFELIHSVSNLALAKEVSKRAEAIGKTQSILLQTNFSGEESKAGLRRDELGGELAELLKLPALSLRGVMDFPPPFANHDEAYLYYKSYIAEIRSLGDDLNWRPEIFSLGTSGDYKAAIQAGANMVRLGTVLFGARSSQ